MMAGHARSGLLSAEDAAALAREAWNDPRRVAKRAEEQERVKEAIARVKARAEAEKPKAGRPKGSGKGDRTRKAPQKPRPKRVTDAAPVAEPEPAPPPQTLHETQWAMFSEEWWRTVSCPPVGAAA